MCKVGRVVIGGLFMCVGVWLSEGGSGEEMGGEMGLFTIPRPQISWFWGKRGMTDGAKRRSLPS